MAPRSPCDRQYLPNERAHGQRDLHRAVEGAHVGVGDQYGRPATPWGTSRPRRCAPPPVSYCALQPHARRAVAGRIDRCMLSV